MNLKRRHLTKQQAACAAVRNEEIIKPKAKENQGTRTDLTYGRILPNVETRKEVAKIAKVSHDTVSRVKFIEENRNLVSQKIDEGLEKPKKLH